MQKDFYSKQIYRDEYHFSCYNDSCLRFYYPRLNLPEGCTCVMYRLESEKFAFWLMRNPRCLVGSLVYTLVIHTFGKNVRVTSDVPTVCVGPFGYVCSSNEILSESVREFVTSSFCVQRFSCFKMSRFFILQGHRLDEIELNGGNADVGCDYFVQTDPFCEAITDILENGKRLKLGKIKDRKFKDPKEIVKFLEEKFGKKGRSKEIRREGIYNLFQSVDARF